MQFKNSTKTKPDELSSERIVWTWRQDVMTEDVRNFPKWWNNYFNNHMIFSNLYGSKIVIKYLELKKN